MKTIKLHSMKLTAFKGIKSLQIDFDDETNIFGANGTGKTTVMDAFLWLLFDKDSSGRKDFEIKTLKDGVPIPQIEHEVEAVISVDGLEIEIRKVYSEKWTKKRGSSEAEFTGHETNYFWNGVPMRQMDFTKNVSEICDEGVFKLITSPTAFNSLHWEERRSILMELAGEISDEDIAGDNPNYLKVVQELSRVNSEEDYRKKLQASVRKQKDELELIPARIDEVERGKPEAVDFSKIQKDLESKREQIQKIDEAIENSTKAYQLELNKINEHNRLINQVKIEIDNLEYKAKRTANQQANESDSNNIELEINTANQKLQSKLADKISLTNSINVQEQKIANITAELNNKRAEWIAVNSEDYKGDENCPTCHQHLPEDMLDSMSKEFNTQKQEKLSRIDSYGQAMKSEKLAAEQLLEEKKHQLTQLNNEIEEAKNRVQELEAQRQNATNTAVPVDSIYQSILENDADYKAKTKELASLQSQTKEAPVIDNSELKTQKSELQFEIDTLKIELNKKQLITQADERIANLKENQKKLAGEIAGVDKALFDLESFIKLKVEEIERRIRNKFQFVSFRMFKEQVNGGLKPTCDTLVKGVPFGDVNTAGKINAGVDIINTLSDFYGITAPIFLDNRESVTDVLPTDAQLVNLIVSPGDLQLRIEQKGNLELISK